LSFEFEKFAFEKLSSNSFKSQRWRALMITASGNSHHWRSLKSPAYGKDQRLRLSIVTRQWWSTAGGCLMWPANGDSIYIYTRRALKNFPSLSRNETTPFGCQIFPLNAAPPTTPPSSRSARPTSTSAPPLSARAHPLLPVDRRRLPLGRRPFSRGPPPRRRPRAPRRPTTSSSSATDPLRYQDDVLLPTGCFPNRRPGTAAASADSSAAPARHLHLISSSLATHGGRGWGRRLSNDSPGLVGFFFKMQLHVLKMRINRLWINAITWIVDK
jgi:hypothetical protein